MIEQHRKCLAAIEAAEKGAAELVKAGAKIPAVQQRLALAREEINSRIKFYEREARDAAPRTSGRRKPAEESKPEIQDEKSEAQN